MATLGWRKYTCVKEFEASTCLSHLTSSQQKWNCCFDRKYCHFICMSEINDAEIPLGWEIMFKNLAVTVISILLWYSLNCKCIVCTLALQTLWMAIWSLGGRGGAYTVVWKFESICKRHS